MFDIRLKAGREKPLLRGHPWIFSGAIAESESHSDIQPGETVRVIDDAGNFIAWGAFSPKSQIRVRTWSRDPRESIDDTFFYSRIEKSIQLRKALKINEVSNAYRIIHAESDKLPGVIVDQYSNTLVIQLLSFGAELWREKIVNMLTELTGLQRVFERSDAKVRHLEGLPERVGILRGDDSFAHTHIREWDRNYYVDIHKGQKTGFYLDQRLNRKLLTELVADCSVLDCFAYSGGFSIAALAGDARHVTAIDSSADAINLGMKNVELNSLSQNRIEWVEGDVFKVLRKYRDQGKKFDVIVLDPPKFAPTTAHAQRAARGYKDINMLALKLLNQDGKLVTFSCSGGISEEFFQKILAGAALDAGVDAQIINRLGPGPDHPVALSFPEGAYLKGFVIQI
jgi:23S rRNA (cytosine1962-C5)-methyltransferase